MAPPVRAQQSYSVRGHTVRKAILILFVAVYVAVAYAGGRHSLQGEYFPAFNWSLFTYVYPERGLFELYVLRIGDKTFKAPVNYFELDDYFESARIRSTDVKKTLERFYAAQRSGDAQAVEKLRDVIETQHLGGHGVVQYQIRYVVFMPVERWLHGTTIEEVVLAHYETGTAP